MRITKALALTTLRQLELIFTMICQKNLKTTKRTTILTYRFTTAIPKRFLKTMERTKIEIDEVRKINTQTTL